MTEEDKLANAIRAIVWLPGCEGDDSGTWDTISDDAKFVWRRAARAALAVIHRTDRLRPFRFRHEDPAR
jgi:hypothetical protein